MEKHRCVLLIASGRLCVCVCGGGDAPLGALTELHRPGLQLNSPQLAVSLSGAHFLDQT